MVLGLGTGEGGDDALYDQAVAIVAKDRKCSTSYIQRKLGIGYNKAAPVGEAKLEFKPDAKPELRPETKTAEGYLKRGRFEDAIRQSKLALGRDERYVPTMAC